MPILPIHDLRNEFGERLKENEPLRRHTSSRVGGPADGLLLAKSREELVKIVSTLSERRVPFIVLGGGSNVLVSDAGLHKVVVINQSRQVRFDKLSDPPSVWAESGANLGLIARQAAARGLAGLEWAAGIPGSLGGGVVGNAGAHGSEMSKSLIVAEILHLNLLTGEFRQPVAGFGLPAKITEKPAVEEWTVEQLDFKYRSSILKRQEVQAVVLSASLHLERSTPKVVRAKMDEYTAYRHRTQPPGASMGSMFKNPPGDFAGRLIESAGLKGARQGDAQISPLHGNFFVNLGQAKAAEVYTLIELARRTVYDQTGIQLELEIELLGEWEFEKTSEVKE